MNKYNFLLCECLSHGPNWNLENSDGSLLNENHKHTFAGNRTPRKRMKKEIVSQDIGKQCFFYIQKYKYIKSYQLLI